MSDLKALIEELETVAEGSRYLDVKVYLAATQEGRDVARVSGFDALSWAMAAVNNPTLPCYTTSIDAALKLVPRGWFWRVGETSLFAGWAFLHETHPDHGQPNVNEFGWHRERGTTPALALCIVALKALAAGARPKRAA